MSYSASTLPIADTEWMARFVTVAQWIRADGIIRPDAFVPPSDLQISVTRHGALSDKDLWRIDQIAATRKPALHGRADLIIGDVSQCGLRAEEDPLPDNDHHAQIVGWPSEKSARKSVAQELAAKAVFRRR